MAAVAMVFLKDKDRPQILLTKRSLLVPTHKGQVGFPGGRREKADIGPIDTALRETYEEVGLAPEQLHVHGCLDTAESLSGDPIVPVVMSTDVPMEQLKPNPHEVSRVFVVPASFLTRDKSDEFDFVMFGKRRHSYLYQIESETIWGLTAQIIYYADLML